MLNSMQPLLGAFNISMAATPLVAVLAYLVTMAF